MDLPGQQLSSHHTRHHRVPGPLTVARRPAARLQAPAADLAALAELAATGYPELTAGGRPVEVKRVVWSPFQSLDALAEVVRLPCPRSRSTRVCACVCVCSADRGTPPAAGC